MFFNIPEGTKLILAGNGVSMDDYRDFIDTYYLYYEVTAIADTAAYRNEAYLRGLDIIPYEEWENREGVLVLFGKTWFKDGENLHRLGYSLIRDYIPAWFFSVGFREALISFSRLCDVMTEGTPEQYFRYIAYTKKIAVAYGDGNIPKINKVLSRVKEFCEDYVIISLPPVQAIAKENIVVFDELWKYARLLIAQPIAENSLIKYEYTTEAVKEKLRPNCKVVIIPVFSFWGYFPQAYVKKDSPVLTDDEGNSYRPFPYGDKNLDEAVKNEVPLEEMQKILNSKDFYSLTDVEDYVNEAVQNIYKLEQDCDVQYAEWFEKNYKSEKLFLAPSIPSYKLIKFLVDRLLKEIGYTKRQINERNLNWDFNGELPIYESMASILYLSFNVQEVYFQADFQTNKITREEYVEKYYECQIKDVREKF